MYDSLDWPGAVQELVQASEYLTSTGSPRVTFTPYQCPISTWLLVAEAFLIDLQILPAKHAANDFCTVVSTDISRNQRVQSLVLDVF